MMAALYLQVSIISQALIFVTRSRSWSFIERPGLLLATAFVIAQLVRVHFHLTNLNTTVHMGSSFVSVHDFLWYLFIETSSLSEMMHLFQKQTQSIFKYNESFSNWQVATFIAVYANWSFARIEGCGWGWAGVIWLYSLVTYFPLDILKFGIRYILSGKAWDTLLENKVNCIGKTYLYGCVFIILLGVFWFVCFCDKINRLPSLPRKTTVKKRERHNGQPHKGPCTVFNHPKQTAFSLTRTVTGSFQRSPSKPRDVLRWQGKHVVLAISFYYSLIIKKKHQLDCNLQLQAEGVAHAERACWIGGEAERTWHWYDPTTLYCLKEQVFWGIEVPSCFQAENYNDEQGFRKEEELLFSRLGR